MKVALIPPWSLLDKSLGRPMQMLIPKAVGDMRFDGFYRQFGRRPDYWLMMDNGMFEQPPLEIARLVKIAEMFNVQEIVLPDTWAKSGITHRQVREFFQFWNREERSYQPCFQAVVHGGRSVRVAHEFVCSILGEHPEITTVAISRSYAWGVEDPYARIKMAKWITERWNGAYDIHFLGFDDTHHEELAAAAALVRSIDTVAPFTAAYHRSYLDKGGAFKRPEDYFELSVDRFPIALVKANIAYLDRLAAGK